MLNYFEIHIFWFKTPAPRQRKEASACAEGSPGFYILFCW